MKKHYLGGGFLDTDFCNYIVIPYLGFCISMKLNIYDYLLALPLIPNFIKYYSYVFFLPFF